MKSVGVRAGSRCLVVLATLVTATLAAAQTPTETPPPPRSRADFLFGRPKAAIAVRGSWVLQRAGSDLFDFVTSQLTIDKGDFNTFGVDADVAIPLTTRFDARAGFELNRSETASEYRDLVDDQFLPIEQRTFLRVIHISGGLRYSLLSRGDEVSRLAWVPRRVVPYVGAGAGAIYYHFRQTGDFVDFADFSVFPETFRSRGWTPAAHAFAGVDVQVHRGLYATFEGRFTRAAATLSSDFVDFDALDLSGFRLSGGVNVLF